MKGSAVSAAEVAQQAQWGYQSCVPGHNPGMGSGSHLDLPGPGSECHGRSTGSSCKEQLCHRAGFGALLTPKLWHYQTFLSWICSVSRELLCPCIASVQGERRFLHVGWSSLHFLCWCCNFCFSPGQNFSPFLPLGGGELGKPFARGSPNALCFQVPQIQCWCCLPNSHGALGR